MTDPSTINRPVTPSDAHWPLFIARWFIENSRDLPWRTDPPDPYYVWLSEIMLQQTRIETVIPYFERFTHDYPTVYDLANAPLDDVLKHWEGLGYYSRARNLHKAAVLIAKRPDGFPSSLEEIKALPGIGDYTAGAISAIAFSLPAIAVDGNVMRVVSRLYALEDDVLKESSRRTVRELLREVYPSEYPGAFVQGLMELGETICLPSSPKCLSCPVRECCVAFLEERTDELPKRESRTRRRIEDLAVFLIKEDHRILLAKRPEDTVLAGLWELPNVPDADDPALLFLNKYGIRIRPGRLIRETDHVFTHITWHMRLFEASLSDCLTASSLPEGLLLADRDTIGKKIMLPTAFRKLLS
ncbi:MAG: A/G-specific adenine glycosylase [Firmicutes bacterium]|nr:A/G-specific adenine glycosylase [Bacillota bacterium]